MDTSAYRAFAGASRHSKAALTGESADEIFGGYSRVCGPDLPGDRVPPRCHTRARMDARSLCESDRYEGYAQPLPGAGDPPPCRVVLAETDRISP
ncbi:asparagine synthase-related protein [Streptomyces californicus]|uniref:asparagine synthase-related protein n=1 Tax=Streptomyces californicus TaxID=67351 RepID=UPI00296F2AD0|nr:asparagine synthase-related protein [Streptomyces californicus]MDW4912768.1 asparagine synthase-related protein [Streptomyces californicus]